MIISTTRLSKSQPKRMRNYLKNNMKDKCLIALEIGYEQKDDIINIINEYLENVIIEVKKDLSEKNRMIFVLKNVK